MRRLRLAVLVALALVVSALAASGVSAASGVVGHVYVNDNTAGANTVAGFDRHADGTLTPMSGSPFAVGGAGTGGAIGPQVASQGALQLSSDGRYLLAVDAGSNQISVLRIQWNGSLTPAAGSPVSSGGSDPVSITVHNRFVYVANAGAGDSNYTGFTLGFGGQLQPLAGSTVALPDNAQPGDVLFNGDGTRLVGTRVGSSQIDSFTVGWNGLLTAAAGSPFTAQGAGPFGAEFRPTNPSQLFWPTNPSQLYVSNAHNGGTNLGTVSAFTDGRGGTLTSIDASPFADQQNAPCWVEISHDGRYLFAVNTGSSSISSYAIAADGALSLLGSTPFSEQGALDARLAPDGRTLWVVNHGSNAVSGFAVRGGTLTELSTSPTALPAGASPFGIVVT